MEPAAAAAAAAANNNLYNGIPPNVLPANIVDPELVLHVLENRPHDLISKIYREKTPLDIVRRTPGIYFISKRVDDRIYEKIIFVPNQTEFPGAPEAPRNIREGIHLRMAIAGGLDPAARNIVLARERARLDEIEANPDLAFVVPPPPLNISMLAFRIINTIEPPQPAEERLEEFLTRVPAEIRGSPMADYMLNQFRQYENAARATYEREKEWVIDRRPKTAASLSNLEDVDTWNFYRFSPFIRRQHAVNAWARAHGVLPPRNERRTRRDRKTRRRSSRKRA